MTRFLRKAEALMVLAILLGLQLKQLAKILMTIVPMTVTMTSTMANQRPTKQLAKMMLMMNLRKTSSLFLIIIIIITHRLRVASCIAALPSPTVTKASHLAVGRPKHVSCLFVHSCWFHCVQPWSAEILVPFEESFRVHVQKVMHALLQIFLSHRKFPSYLHI